MINRVFQTFISQSIKCLISLALYSAPMPWTLAAERIASRKTRRYAERGDQTGPQNWLGRGTDCEGRYHAASHRESAIARRPGSIADKGLAVDAGGVGEV